MTKGIIGAASVLLIATAVVLGATIESVFGAEIKVEEVSVDGSLGKVYGVLQTPETNDPTTLVIMSHGFGGNHRHLKGYGEFLAHNGFASYCFDFCGGGRESKSAGTMVEMSVLTEAKDLTAIVDYFQKDARFNQIILFGQSQGGFVSAYVASQRPDDIAAVVLEYPAFVIPDDAKKRANPDGTFPETSAALGTTIGRKYNEDATSFDIYEELAKFKGDVLILHGDKDGLVPLRYSERAAKVFPSAELVVIPGQGHGFFGEGGRTAFEKEIAFFKAHVKKEETK